MKIWSYKISLPPPPSQRFYYVSFLDYTLRTCTGRGGSCQRSGCHSPAAGRVRGQVATRPLRVVSGVRLPLTPCRSCQRSGCPSPPAGRVRGQAATHPLRVVLEVRPPLTPCRSCQRSGCHSPPAGRVRDQAATHPLRVVSEVRPPLTPCRSCQRSGCHSPPAGRVRGQAATHPLRVVSEVRLPLTACGSCQRSGCHSPPAGRVRGQAATHPLRVSSICCSSSLLYARLRRCDSASLKVCPGATMNNGYQTAAVGNNASRKRLTPLRFVNETTECGISEPDGYDWPPSHVRYAVPQCRVLARRGLR